MAIQNNACSNSQFSLNMSRYTKCAAQAATFGYYLYRTSNDLKAGIWQNVANNLLFATFVPMALEGVHSIYAMNLISACDGESSRKASELASKYFGVGQNN